MANRMRSLDPQASPAALFGAELRALRLARGLSLARLGKLVHVSGDLLGKLEKAERRPQPDLVDRLDRALDAGGLLDRLAHDVLDADPRHSPIVDVDLPVGRALPVLCQVVEAARSRDHAMGDGGGADVLIAHARAAERVHAARSPAERPALGRSIAEAYQLAGWISFDQGRPAHAEYALGQARRWVERAADPALAAYVLGPNLSFIATYGGAPALGVERAYGAIGWARRSGNRRLTAFTMAIGARAHARLHEPGLCFDLLDQAAAELDAHVPDARDEGWLSVFDHAALDGHRGSCLLDLGLPARALDPLAAQQQHAAARFVRNRMIWGLDRAEALLGIGEIDQACTELSQMLEAAATPTPRVRRRVRAVQLRLRSLSADGRARDVAGRLGELSGVPG